jgi:hypothetical protein
MVSVRDRLYWSGFNETGKLELEDHECPWKCWKGVTFVAF